MTRDEIKQAAVDANLYPRHVWSSPEYIEAIERFANLVAEKEREACAKLVENLVILHPVSADKTLDQCAEAIRARSGE